MAFSSSVTERNAAPQGAFGEECEEALDLIDPRGAGRREVDVPARPLGKPVADQLGFMRAVVIHDNVDIETGGHVALDLVEELTELGGAMARHALADNGAGRHVEGGKISVWRASTHAAARDRVQACQRRTGYAGSTTLRCPQEHHAHRRLHRALGRAVQEFLGGLRSALVEHPGIITVNHPKVSYK